jgi:hypothetical protein
MRKKENETIKEFDTKFEKLLQQIPNDIFPRREHLLFLYTNAFPRNFGFMLKGELPKTLEEARELATRIEDNISYCEVEPFYAPRTKADNKPRTLHNIDPTQEISAPWAQNIEEAINVLTQNQTLMMNKITNRERVQQKTMMPYYKGQPQR